MSSKTTVPNQTMENPQKTTIRENIRTIVIALILAVGFRSFVFEPFHIPSGSMKNTLLVGDYLFVSKYSYGYSRYSFPFGFPLFGGRALALNMPKRGDVVVFRYPGNTHIDFIKRLIGLPGDHIQVKEGIVYINGNPLKRQQLNDYAEFIVPPKHYFMMGDNRDNSHDSRFLEDVGYIPEENLIGRAEIVFFSTDGSANFGSPVSWLHAIRTDRFFKTIE